MSVLIKGLNIKPCKDGFGGKGLVIIGYDDKLYAVAHEQIIPLPDHGDLIDRNALKKDLIDEGETVGIDGFSIDGLSADDVCYAIENAPVVIPAERREDVRKPD